LNPEIPLESAMIAQGFELTVDSFAKANKLTQETNDAVPRDLEQSTDS
jgi:hypothetical protein